MTRLELSLLGSFAVKLDGRPVNRFVSDKVRALLVYLAVESTQAHTRERLAELFWPERTQQIARADLRNALSDLRRSLRMGPEAVGFIHFGKDSIQFNCDSDCWLDVAAFQQEIAEAESIQAHSEDLPGAMAHYQSAISLYRGDFLQGFSLKDCAEFEDWCYYMREHLLQKASGALARLAGYHEGRREYDQAITYARRRVELEPWLEAAHLHLMRLLALDGRRAEALEQYSLCCRKLKEELDVQPGGEVTRLYEQIRDGKFIIHNQEAPARLPAYLTPLVGRQVEISTIEAQFQDPSCRLINLAGPGGCGKTRLAVAIAERLIKRFRDGVRFVPLVTLEQVESLPSAIIQALGISSTSGGDSLHSLLSYLRDKELLLVLDNYEQLLPDGTEILERLLKEAPRIKLLVTSRERLHSQAEWLYEVTGLGLPATDQVEAVRACASVQLFTQAAQRLCGYTLPGEDLPAVVRICRMVSGMPLAIEIAASWRRALSCAEIAEEIAHSLAFLHSDTRQLQSRHRSVQAVFESTWKMLAQEEQEVFSRLAVFRGGFTLQAAEAVAGASLLTLTDLLDKCLVLRRPSGRCELHELLRQFAEEKLEQNPANQVTARDLHSEYYSSHLNSLNFIQETKTAVAYIDVEYANCQAAWERCLESGSIEALIQVTLQLDSYLGIKIRYNDSKRLFTNVLEAIPPGAYEAVRAQILFKIGAAESCTGGYKTALEYLQKSLVICEKLSLQTIKARIIGMMGRLCFRDNYKEGIRCHEECNTFLEQNGELAYLPNRYLNQGILCLSKGLVTKSVDCFQKGIAIGRAISDDIWLGVNFDRLGHARIAQGRLSEAEQCFQEMLDILSDAGVPELGEGYYLDGLARVAQRRGKLEQARTFIDQSLAVWNSLLEKGQDVYAVLGFRYFHRCEILEVQEQYGEMKQTALQALHMFQTHQTETVLETPQGIGWSLYMLSRADARLQNFTAARETLEQAIQHFREECYTDWILFCLAAWGEFMVKEDPCAARKQLALELLTLVLDHPRMQEIEFHPAAKGWADLEQDADRLANGLLPAQAEQARQTGHVLSLDVVVDEIIRGKGWYSLRRPGDGGVSP